MNTGYSTDEEEGKIPDYQFLKYHLTEYDFLNNALEVVYICIEINHLLDF